MTSANHPDALPEDHQIQEYEFLSVLGEGGFGITYLAQDTLLDRKIAIKEYLPRDFAIRTTDHSVRPRSPSESGNYTWGLKRFLDEARILASLNHPSIIRIYKYFEAHGSGYIVMEYIDGETLSERLRRENTLSESQLMNILNPLIQGLEQVHATGYLHRDIKPMNILLRKDGMPVLIDFGSARQELGARSRSVTAVATPGYAPLEQYSSRGKQQGPWTDIYGLSAVAYRCITGTVPKDAIERAQGETLTPASQAAKDQYTGGLLTVVDQGLAVKAEDRPQDLKVWKLLLMQGSILSDAETQISFGDMYYMGYGVPRNYAEAAKWYRLIAEQGDARSQYNLGLMYANGYGMTQDDIKAASWLQRSANQGYKKALTWLRLAAGQGDAEAVKSCWRAAGQDYAAAQYNLSRIIAQGDVEAAEWLEVSIGGNIIRCRSRNDMEAAEWLERSADKGFAEAQYDLGIRHRIWGNHSTAIEWWRLAAEQGHTKAQVQLGWMYDEGRGVPQSYAEAVKWFRWAAKQGDAEGQFNLGWVYDEGHGVPQSYAEAIKWYRRAAEQGHANAQFNLGGIYEERQSYAEAIKWWRRAAEQGYTGAQNNLGVMYHKGQGVPQSDAEAVKWFRWAAEQDNAGAQHLLGRMYEEGHGVTQDYVEAYKWYDLAASRFSAVRKKLDKIAERMTQKEVATAQYLAKEWQPKTWAQLKTD